MHDYQSNGRTASVFVGDVKPRGINKFEKRKDKTKQLRQIVIIVTIMEINIIVFRTGGCDLFSFCNCQEQ